MVRVAWMKNCGGKREGGRGGWGPWEGEEGEWGVEEVGWGEEERARKREGRKQVCFWSFSGAVGGDRGEVVASERVSRREKINAKKASEAEGRERGRGRGRREYLVCIRRGSCIRLDVSTRPLSSSDEEEKSEME